MNRSHFLPQYNCSICFDKSTGRIKYFRDIAPGNDSNCAIIKCPGIESCDTCPFNMDNWGRPETLKKYKAKYKKIKKEVKNEV